jgi:hypothetical protein
VAESLSAREDRHWRKLGYHAEQAECQSAVRGGTPRKRDLYGFIDRVYLGPDGEQVYVQITSADHVHDRMSKILTGSTGHGQWRVRHAELARRLLVSTNTRIIVVGYQPPDPKVYEYRRRELELDLITAERALALPVPG